MDSDKLQRFVILIALSEHSYDGSVKSMNEPLYFTFKAFFSEKDSEP